MISAQFEPHFESWRAEARRLLAMGTRPENIQWGEKTETLNLFSEIEFVSDPAKGKTAKVSAEFLESARLVSMSRDPGKWDLLYRILFRLSHGEPELLHILVDTDVLRFNHLVKSVRRDLHKLHAFVRFKEVEWQGTKRYIAWHRPEHPCLVEGATFFVRRFGDKPWSIFTPDESAHWDLKELSFSEGIPQHQFEGRDDFDELWKSYYTAIFNPARIKIKAMKSEMAPKYWNSLPEAELIQDLIRQAPLEIQRMAARQNTQALVPVVDNFELLKQAAKNCKACPLHLKSTQTVFGEGPVEAHLMIVGEQPGDEEDFVGRTFIGPAGEMLNHCLGQAGLDRDKIYVTNAVKHFKWVPGNNPSQKYGKARIHKTPSGSEMHACRPWLEAEIQLVKPRTILALGATAATSVLGRLPKIGVERGKVFSESPFAKHVIISWHPSAILRSTQVEDRNQKVLDLISDLQLATSLE